MEPHTQTSRVGPGLVGAQVQLKIWSLFKWNYLNNCLGYQNGEGTERENPRKQINPLARIILLNSKYTVSTQQNKSPLLTGPTSVQKWKVVICCFVGIGVLEGMGGRGSIPIPNALSKYIKYIFLKYQNSRKYNFYKENPPFLWVSFTISVPFIDKYLRCLLKWPHPFLEL